MRKIRIDITGLRFERLKVLSYDKTISKRAFWLCECDCGAVKSLPGSDMKTGKIKSCGCLRKENSAEAIKQNTREDGTPIWRRSSYGFSSMKSMYYRYIRDAKARGIEFTLSLGEFAELTSQSCYICGCSPANAVKYNKDSFGAYICNGIDRLDNSKGYIYENCLGCCTSCNSMKRNITPKVVARLYEVMQNHNLL